VSRGRIAAVLIAIGVLAAAAAGGWVMKRLEQAPQYIATRLGAALGGDCRIDRVVPLDLRSVEITGLACALETGPLAGAAARRLQVTFVAPPLAGSLPPVEHLTIYGAVLRLRARTADGLEDDDSGDDDSADIDLSSVAEVAALRFADLTEAIAGGRGGDRVPAVIARLAEGGEVRIDRALLQAPDGSILIRELAIRATRRGESLETALATTFPAGGLATFEGSMAVTGLLNGRLEVEDWPVARALQEAGGGRLQVLDGLARGSLEYRRGVDGTGEWAVKGTLSRLSVVHDFLGGEVLPLPDVGLEGTLRPIRDGDGVVLAIESSRWSVADQGGPLHSMFGPLGAAVEPLITLSVEAERLSLGRLLEQLPEALLPSEWAREIQGTMDFTLELGGPVHDRSRWELDWTSDFSRMTLASGDLAREVELLLGPFHHEFPILKDNGRPLRRIMGIEDPAFVSIRGISPHLIAAVISTEDAGFFGHAGFETKELKEAMLENLREGSGRGGSTITQQLAKNLFLSGERSIARKLKEAVLAWRLEEDLPKRRILEIYLNIAEWGPGLYGIRDAADHYFNRTPSHLRPEEAAFLASLLPSPVRYHGYYHRRGVSTHLQNRIQEILTTMRRLGSLDARQYHLARDERLELSHCNSPPPR
jgi:hypothetical protein